MKRILAVITIIVVFAVAFIATSELPNLTGLVVADAEDNEIEEKKLPNFRIYTGAVCEDTKDFIVCRDELFVNCNNTEFIVPREGPETVECDGIELQVPKDEVNGNGIFSKDWEDPRNG